LSETLNRPFKEKACRAIQDQIKSKVQYKKLHGRRAIIT